MWYLNIKEGNTQDYFSAADVCRMVTVRKPFV